MILTESNNPQRSIYSPIRIGGLELSNRLVMAPVAIHLAPITGEISEDTIRYFLERARGGVGLILMGGTGWARVDAAHPSIPYEQVSFYKKERTEGHKRLVEALKRTGVKLGVQIHHRGRQAPRHPFDCVPVAPSSIPWSPRAEVPQALSISEIDSLIERYGKIAEQAKRIGFDLVEIHAAHGYLVSNFLSPDSNQRHDQYGGDLQGRARFLIDIVKNVRNAVGSNYPISIRMNGSDFKKGGLTLEESKKIAHLLEGSGVDLINVSGGVNGSFPLTISPYYVQKGYFVHLSEEIKKEVNIPVMVAGRIHEIPFAQKILEEGKADLIAIGRGLIADPYLPLKSFQGKEMDIRKCLSCNYCIDTFSYGAGEMACVVNPSLGKEKEAELMPAKRRKVIWVIGAGLAGMEAAWRASARGHSVTLLDKENDPGGMWILASNPPEKQHFKFLIDYFLNRIQQSGVTTFFNKNVSSEDILKAKPDVVIIATGAEPKEGLISSLKDKERTSGMGYTKREYPQL